MSSPSPVIFAASISAAVLVGCDVVGLGSKTPGLSMVSGDRQAGSAGQALRAPLVVQVRDASGRVVAGASVSWVVTSGNGSVPGGSGTDTRGLSSVIWTLGVEGIHQSVRASITFGADSSPSSFAPVTFGATANGAATTIVSVRGDSQVAIVGDTLPVPLRVRAATATGDGVAGVRVAWTVGEGSVFPEFTLTDAVGEATASWVLGATIGQQTARATAFLEGSPRTFTATVNRAANALTWTAEQLPAISSCNVPFWTGIWAASATEVFAVGGCGTVRHFGGSSWDFQNSGTTRYVWKVWGRSSTDVFIVADSGTLLHYDGASWSPLAAAPSVDGRAIWGPSGELFLVAFELPFSLRSSVWHYDGASWTMLYQRPGCPLGTIWGSSASDVFVVGPGKPVHYDGLSWYDGGCSVSDWRSAVAGNGPGEVYLTGGFECASYRSPCTSLDFVEQYANGAWVRRWAQPGGRSLRDLWVGPNGDVVVVGVNGLILHADGSHWRPESSGTTATIIAVSASDPTSVWAITTGGLVLHGTRATAAPSASAPQ